MRSDRDARHDEQSRVRIIRISADERERERVLREHFARFWASAKGDPRAVYDSFIAASPLTGNVALEQVDSAGVSGWWVRPELSKLPMHAVLFLHGGGYVQGSAQAYRGFVSQLVSRTQRPALVIDYPLAPEATLPAAPTAAIEAWKLLVAQGYERIAVVGDSAGGGLTLVTLAELVRGPQGTTPVAGVVFSPWADLAFTGKSMIDAAIEDPLISYELPQREAAQVGVQLDGAAADRDLPRDAFAQIDREGVTPELEQAQRGSLVLHV